MSNYRRMRKGDPNPVHFSPTEMAKCPIKLTEKKEGASTFKYTERLNEIFEAGSRIHVNDGIYRHNARGLVDTELHLTVIAKDLTHIFSGYMDFLMIDEFGLYIEDLKSCNRNAFYHFNKSPEAFSEKIQVSFYRWLYFQVHGVIIDRAIITKIDRENPLNRISLEIDMFSLEWVDEFLEDHPSILKATGTDIPKPLFLKRTYNIIKQNRWVCNYCDDKDTCVVNLKLKSEEKEQKKAKKKAKATFQKLVK